MTTTRKTRTALLASAALLGGAVPAIASRGGEHPGDGNGHHTTTTTGATGATGPGKPFAGGEKATAAAAAAQAAVQESTTVVSVRRKVDGERSRGHGRGHAKASTWEVSLKGTAYRYKVRLDRDLKVLRVQRTGKVTTTGTTGTTDSTGAAGTSGASGTTGTTA